MDLRFEHFKDFSARSMSFADKLKGWLEVCEYMAAADFDALFADNKARQSRVPAVGEAAPDFEVERLDRARQRTGEFVRRSAWRGRPVALAFGS